MPRRLEFIQKNAFKMNTFVAIDLCSNTKTHKMKTHARMKISSEAIILPSIQRKQDAWKACRWEDCPWFPNYVK